ncbi:MAG: zinc ribbon domain-containing protein, partial [Acidobacteria bacterium]|nr:zinc ribbon domain-containing protein [Acidobacteriota bacterium]
MAEPVIARRCQKCGASIRDAAAYCPQCGNHLAQRDSEKHSPPVTPEETISDPATTLGDTLDDPIREVRKEGPVQSRKESRKKDGQSSHPETAVRAPAPGAARASMSKTARGAVGAKLQRATSMARDVEG